MRIGGGLARARAKLWLAVVAAAVACAAGVQSPVLADGPNSGSESVGAPAAHPTARESICQSGRDLSRDYADFRRRMQSSDRMMRNRALREMAGKLRNRASLLSSGVYCDDFDSDTECKEEAGRLRDEADEMMEKVRSGRY